MSLWKIRSLPSGIKVNEIDANQLILRLQSLIEQGNVEVIQLAIESMLEELREEVTKCIGSEF